jgi:hypothetical protein
MTDVANIVEDKKQEYYNSVAVLKKFSDAKRVRIDGKEEWTSVDVNSDNAKGMRLVMDEPQRPGHLSGTGGKVYLYTTVKRPKRPVIHIYGSQVYKLTNKHIEALVNDVAGARAIDALKRALSCQELPKQAPAVVQPPGPAKDVVLGLFARR